MLSSWFGFALRLARYKQHGLASPPAGGRSRSPGQEERAPRTPARPSSTFLAGGSGEAPRPLPTVLLLTVPGQRCALVPAQERGTGTQTRSGTGSVTMGAAGVGCSLLLGPVPELHRWALGT